METMFKEAFNSIVNSLSWNKDSKFFDKDGFDADINREKWQTQKHLKEHKEIVETDQDHEAIKAFSDYLTYVLKPEEKWMLFKQMESEWMESFVENYLWYNAIWKMIAVWWSWLIGVWADQSTTDLQDFWKKYVEHKKKGTLAVLVKEYVDKLPAEIKANYKSYSDTQADYDKSLEEAKKKDENDLKNNEAIVTHTDESWVEVEEKTSDKEVLRLYRAKKVLAIANQYAVDKLAYQGWSNDPSNWWIDCSWLIEYSFEKAGLKSLWRYSALQCKNTMKHNVAKIRTKDDALDNAAKIKPWMLMFWHCTDPKSPYSQHHATTFKWIHHVAIIADPAVTPEWRINIIESNGSNGCVARAIRPEEASWSKESPSTLIINDVDYVNA